MFSRSIITEFECKAKVRDHHIVWVRFDNLQYSSDFFISFCSSVVSNRFFADFSGIFIEKTTFEECVEIKIHIK